MLTKVYTIGKIFGQTGLHGARDQAERLPKMLFCLPSHVSGAGVCSKTMLGDRKVFLYNGGAVLNDRNCSILLRRNVGCNTVSRLG